MELFDRWLGHADVSPQEEQDRLLALALADEGLQPVRKVRRRLVLSKPQRRLRQEQVGHRYALGRREQRQHRTRGVSEDHCSTADCVDDSAQILGPPARARTARYRHHHPDAFEAAALSAEAPDPAGEATRLPEVDQS